MDFHQLELPFYFEPNLGRTAPGVAFLARGTGVVLELGPEGGLRLRNRTAAGNRPSVFEMRLDGAEQPRDAEGFRLLPGRSNYYLGNQPSAWRTGVPHFGGVRFHGVYPGVNLVYHVNGNLLEYDLEISPGADAAPIKFRFAGITAIEVDDHGGLVLDTAVGTLRKRAPVAYQEIAGARVPVPCEYVLSGENSVTFRLGEYQRDLKLTIDPILDYATYLGGEGSDEGNGVAVDTSGNVYVTGRTDSASFPATLGAVQEVHGGDGDVYVAKLSDDGSTLQYVTYLGGAGNDQGNAIAVNAAGEAYVTGYGESGFPTTVGAYQTRCCGAFAAKLDATGGVLLYSTFLGSGDPYGVAVDGTGNLYIAGSAYSSFPVTGGAYQTTFGGGLDAFVAKLDASGANLVYSTLLGGNNYDRGYGIAISDAGEAFIAGYTYSSNFPVTPGSYQQSQNGHADGFVAKLNASGTGLTYSTFLGGASRDEAHGVAISASGVAYVTGFTLSEDFPVTAGAYRTTPVANQYSGFVTAVNTLGSGLDYSTFIGAVTDYYSTRFGIAVDQLGSAFVTGTAEPGFPVTGDALQATFGGGSDAFLVQLNATGTAAEYSTFLGGAADDHGRAVAVDSARRVYIAGATTSGNFPATPGAPQSTAGAQSDAFVVRIDSVSVPCDIVPSPLSSVFGAAGGSGAINVNTAAGCVWSATNDDSWITFTSSSSGTGSGTLQYDVAGNPADMLRTGTIMVGTTPVQISQAGVAKPPPPSGPTAGVVNQGYEYSTGGVVLPGSGAMEYRFDWGDGNISGWGAAMQTVSWPFPGVYFVRAQARNSAEAGILTSWSDPSVVNIHNPVGILTNEVFGEQVYWDILNRPSDPAGLAAVVNALNAGALTRSEIALNLIESPEYLNKGAFIIRCYLAIMQRGPDFGGWVHWYGEMGSGSTNEMIVAEFVKADEFVQLYGQLTDAEFVTLVYQNVLGRDPDQAGFDHWMGQLGSGALTRAGMMTQFIISAEYTQKTEEVVEAQTLHLALWRRTAALIESQNWEEYLSLYPLLGAVEYFLTSPEYLNRFQ